MSSHYTKECRDRFDEIYGRIFYDGNGNPLLTKNQTTQFIDQFEKEVDGLISFLRNGHYEAPICERILKNLSKELKTEITRYENIKKIPCQCSCHKNYNNCDCYGTGNSSDECNKHYNCSCDCRYTGGSDFYGNTPLYCKD